MQVLHSRKSAPASDMCAVPRALNISSLLQTVTAFRFELRDVWFLPWESRTGGCSFSPGTASSIKECYQQYRVLIVAEVTTAAGSPYLLPCFAGFLRSPESTGSGEP